jgi:hypothetical protein
MFFAIIFMSPLRRNAGPEKNNIAQHKTALFSIGISTGGAAMKS